MSVDVEEKDILLYVISKGKYLTVLPCKLLEIAVSKHSS